MKRAFEILSVVLLVGMLVAILNAGQACAAPSVDVWSKTYGGTNWDKAQALVQTADSGYALAGYTGSYGAGLYDFWLVKTDTSGNVQWNKTYGGTLQDEAQALVQTADSGYALAGYTYTYGAGSEDFWLVKTDLGGDMQWNQTYGGTGEDFAQALVQTDDGGYALAGLTDSYGVGFDFWLVKTDSSGNAQWNKTYGGTNADGAWALVKTTDGGYALAGFTNAASIYGIGGDFWLVKTDAAGNAQWNKTYGGTLQDEAYALVQTSDGGYALAGLTGAGGPDTDFWLVKTDANGVVPEFSSPIVLAALFVVASSAVIVARKKLKGSLVKPY